MCVEIKCLNYRFPTAVADDDISTYHLSKLECQDDKRIDPWRNLGAYKSVGEKCRNVPDKEEMFLPMLEFPNPINCASTECLELSLLMGELPIRISSVKNNSERLRTERPDCLTDGDKEDVAAKVPRSRFGGAGV